MITEAHLLSVIDAFSSAKGWKDATISSHVFNDGKKVAQLRAGGSITLSRLNEAFYYLSKNWPDNAVWPDSVDRPAIEADPAQNTQQAN
jgi:hypothetical protein